MERIGPYEIQGELGRGGMGVVYRGRDPRSGRSVAVKVLTKGREATKAQKKRFAREAHALTTIKHPNVVRLREAGEHDGYPYLVMDFHAEGSLAATLEASGPLSPGAVARIGVSLASALVAVHAEEVLHRDIKPDNVLINASGTPLLTDFGLAKRLDPDEESSKITQHGGLTGTPGFWAPEQVSGSEEPGVGPWTDVYGLGATLYAALTGRPPVDGDSMVEMLVATTCERPSSIRASRPEVPTRLEEIVMRCLEKRPEDRWTSAALLRAALSDSLAGPETPTAPPTYAAEAETPPARRPAWPIAVGVTLLAAAAAVGITRDPDPRPTEALLPGDPKSRPTAAPTPTEPSDQSLEARAARGEGAAMVKLGRELQRGVGRPRDRAAGVRWFRRAAAQGNAEGMYRLGNALFYGSGVPKNRPASRRWLERAAALGDPRPMVNLGVIAQEREDYAEALRWFLCAAALGEARGFHNLAVVYQKGLGVPRRPALAAWGFRVAAEHGLSSAQYQLGQLYMNGSGVEKDFREARRWFREAAAHGSGPAQANFGSLLLRGLGGPKDEAAAATWYRRAAEQGIARAMGIMGWLHEYGRGAPKDDVAALRWYRDAATAGDQQAAYDMSRLLWAGRGAPRDRAGAMRWCKKAARGGHPMAMARVGFMYTEPPTGQPDYERAAKWLKRGVEAGVPNAMFNLGLLYASGQGVPRDVAAAARLFRRAAAGDDVGLRREAREALADLERRTKRDGSGGAPR